MNDTNELSLQGVRFLRTRAKPGDPPAFDFSDERRQEPIFRREFNRAPDQWTISEMQVGHMLTDFNVLLTKLKVLCASKLLPLAERGRSSIERWNYFPPT